MNTKCKKVHEQLEKFELLTTDMTLVASAIMILDNVQCTDKFFDTSIDNDVEMSVSDIIVKLKSMGTNLMLSQCDFDNSIVYMR